MSGPFLYKPLFSDSGDHSLPIPALQSLWPGLISPAQRASHRRLRSIGGALCGRITSSKRANIRANCANATSGTTYVACATGIVHGVMADCRSQGLIAVLRWVGFPLSPLLDQPSGSAPGVCNASRQADPEFNRLPIPLASATWYDHPGYAAGPWRELAATELRGLHDPPTAHVFFSIAHGDSQELCEEAAILQQQSKLDRPRDGRWAVSRPSQSPHPRYQRPGRVRGVPSSLYRRSLGPPFMVGEGVKDSVVIPISFVSETSKPSRKSHRVPERSRRKLESQGNFRRGPGPRYLPTFIKGLADLVETALAGPEVNLDSSLQSSPPRSALPQENGSGPGQQLRGLNGRLAMACSRFSC